MLDPAAVTERWPQFRLPEGTLALHQEDAAIVPAGRGTRVMQDVARRYGADLRDHTPVRSVRDLGDGGIEVQTPRACCGAADSSSRPTRGPTTCSRASGSRSPSR